MRVKSVDEVIAKLKEQGAAINSQKDLEPKYLGKQGYVGCPVRVHDQDRTIWVVSVDVVNLGGNAPKADSAEWLTLTLVAAGGQLKITELMSKYLSSYAADSSRQDARRHDSVTEIEALSMLAYIADFMGLIEDPLQDTISLPEDHPMYDEAVANRG